MGNQVGSRARRDEIARAIALLDAMSRAQFAALYRDQVRDRAAALSVWARGGRAGPKPSEKLLEVFGKRLLDLMVAEGGLNRAEFPPCDKALSSVADGRGTETGGLEWTDDGTVVEAGGKSWLVTGANSVVPASPPQHRMARAETDGATWGGEDTWLVCRDVEGKEIGSILLGGRARCLAASPDRTRVAVLVEGGVLHVVATDRGGDPYAACTGTCRELLRVIFWRDLPGPVVW
jgi:hypothetical protein